MDHEKMRTPELVVPRRVYSAVHMRYSPEEQEHIWRSVWLQKKAETHSARCVLYWAFICVVILIIAGLWRLYPNALWVGAVVPVLLWWARLAHIRWGWYEMKRMTLMHGREEFYERAGEVLADAFRVVEQDDPTITIAVRFKEGELP